VQRDPRPDYKEFKDYELWEGVTAEFQYLNEDDTRQFYVKYPGYIKEIRPKLSKQPTTVVFAFDDDYPDYTVKRGPSKSETGVDFRDIFIDAVSNDELDARRQQVERIEQRESEAARLLVLKDARRPDDGRVIEAAFENTTGFLVVRITGELFWRLPWACFNEKDSKDFTLFRSFIESPKPKPFIGMWKDVWHCDTFKALETTSLYVREEVESFYIGDAEAFQAWAACRNVQLAYRQSQSDGVQPVGYSSHLLSKSMFDANHTPDGSKQTMLSSLKELIAWLFTINFAGRNVPNGNDGVGWQWAMPFLVRFNRLIQQTSAGAEDTAERSFNEGLDPANTLGESVYPNDGIDGKVTGAAKLWSADTHNKFGMTKDTPWVFNACETYDLVTAGPLMPPRPVTRGPKVKARPPEAARFQASLREIRDADDAITSRYDDGGTKAAAATQDVEDMEKCKADPATYHSLTNPAASFQSASPVTAQMASLFGTLSHEWALTELLGACYCGVRSDEAARQMQTICDFVGQFPTVCSRVGQVLSSKLLRDVVLALDPVDRATVSVTGAVDNVMSVDLLSALPYTYPPLAAVPDGLFRRLANGKQSLVVAEFKTQWRKSGRGFRWTVGDGKAYRRQALYEAVAHWLTAGSAENFVPVEAWVVVAKTPSLSPIKACKAYSACCRIETLDAMMRLVKGLYAAVFDSTEKKQQRLDVTVMTPYAMHQKTKKGSKLAFKTHLPPEGAPPKDTHFSSSGNSILYHPLGKAVWFSEPPFAAFGRPVHDVVDAWATECNGSPNDIMSATLKLAFDAAVCSCQPVEQLWAGQLVSCLQAWLKPVGAFALSWAPTEEQIGTLDMLLRGAYVMEGEPDETGWSLEVDPETYNVAFKKGKDHAKVKAVISPESGSELIYCSTPTGLLYKVDEDNGKRILVPTLASDAFPEKKPVRKLRGGGTDLRQLNFAVWWLKPGTYKYNRTAPGVNELPLGCFLEPFVIEISDAATNWPAEATFCTAPREYEESLARLNRDISRALEQRR
jgi:hypothetical protein